MKQQILEAREAYALASLRAIRACLRQGMFDQAQELAEKAVNKLEGED